jgi:hypothetical protein
MCKEYDGVLALQTNISMADMWLKGMAEGAASSNRTVQYCMPYAHDIMSAAAYPAVTNARATGDCALKKSCAGTFCQSILLLGCSAETPSPPPCCTPLDFHSDDQWAIGGTSLFYWALGILPFKDGFYSSSRKQIGGQTEGPETRPDREILMAVLSTAMVGPMDGINLLNASRVLASCRADGYVLKPDRPVATSDACFTLGGVERSSVSAPHDPSSCYIYLTHSDVSGLGRVHYVFSNDGTIPITPAMAHMDPSAAGGYAIYNWYTRELKRMEAGPNAVSGGYEGHSYSIITPSTGGWFFLGEIDKYVPVSTLRFSEVSGASCGTSITAVVVGAAGETVQVCAARTSDLLVECRKLVFTSAGSQDITFKTKFGKVV